MKVALSKIRGTEPRREHGDIEGLKSSIADLGLINPITDWHGFGAVLNAYRTRERKRRRGNADNWPGGKEGHGAFPRENRREMVWE